MAEAAPEAIQEVTTTGNVDFADSVGGTKIDRLVVSCDGVSQGEYEKYRIGGSFERAVRFMRDAKRIGHADTFLEWKYILFDGNDTEQDIALAQKTAEEIGVDSLLFIVTQSKTRSHIWNPGNIGDFPLSWRQAKVSPAAAMMIGTRSQGIPVPTDMGDREAASLYVDECRLTVGGVLLISGWSLASSGAYIDSIELETGDRRHVTKTDDLRYDVAAARPHAQGARCGFLFRIPLKDERPPERVSLRVRTGNHHEAFSVGIAWSRAA